MTLEDEGWQRRFMGEPVRVKEAIELYQAMGFDVRTAPPGETDILPQCNHCRLAADLFRVVYTRRKS